MWIAIRRSVTSWAYIALYKAPLIRWAVNRFKIEKASVFDGVSL